MSIAIETGPRGGDFKADEDALIRLQDILLENAEGARSEELDAEYRNLRKALFDNPEYSDILPRMVRVHRDLGALWPYMKSYDPQWEPRRKHVREVMAPLFDRSEELSKGASASVGEDGGEPSDPPIDPSSWTGVTSPRQRLAAARSLIPIAQGSIERLIDLLSQPNHNGAPPLDDAIDAIDNLRKLHRALGEVLEATERGAWDEALGSGLIGEASGYAKRAARLVKNDPIPYALSALLLSVMTALGFPGIGGYLAGVAVTVRKSPDRGQ